MLFEAVWTLDLGRYGFDFISHSFLQTREYRRFKAVETAAYAECSRIHAALEAKHEAIGTVQIGDETVYHLGHLNTLRSQPGLPAGEYEAARAALEPLQEAHDRAFAESGYDEAEAIAHAAQAKANKALVTLFRSSPTSPLGALEMLRGAVDEIDGSGAEGAFVGGDHIVRAMRTAIAVLEKRLGASS